MAEDKKDEKKPKGEKGGGEKAAKGGGEKPAKAEGGQGQAQGKKAPEGAAAAPSGDKGAQKKGGEGKGDGKGKKGEGKKDVAQTHLAKEGEVARHGAPRLKQLYDKEIAPQLMKDFSYGN